jgi:hypothetical protein
MTTRNQFDEILEPLGGNAADFFLAASLYHARKFSFATAASLANLSFEAFLSRLEEHFGKGFILDDSVVLEDIETVEKLISNTP